MFATFINCILNPFISILKLKLLHFILLLYMANFIFVTLLEFISKKKHFFSNYKQELLHFTLLPQLVTLNFVNFPNVFPRVEVSKFLFSHACNYQECRYWDFAV